MPRTILIIFFYTSGNCEFPYHIPIMEKEKTEEQNNNIPEENIKEDQNTRDASDQN